MKLDPKCVSLSLITPESEFSAAVINEENVNEMSRGYTPFSLSYFISFHISVLSRGRGQMKRLDCVPMKGRGAQLRLCDVLSDAQQSSIKLD